MVIEIHSKRFIAAFINLPVKTLRYYELHTYTIVYYHSLVHEFHAHTHTHQQLIQSYTIAKVH